jgi:hypothetical protein
MPVALEREGANAIQQAEQVQPALRELEDGGGHRASPSTSDQYFSLSLETRSRPALGQRSLVKPLGHEVQRLDVGFWTTLVNRLEQLLDLALRSRRDVARRAWGDSDARYLDCSELDGTRL